MAVVRKSIDAEFTEWDCQLAVAQLFRYRNGNTAIPSCTTFGWEMDVAIITGAGYLYEVEIKRSLSDWKADEKKDKWGMSRHQVCKFYYAIPPELLDKKPSFVSDDTGIIILNKNANPNAGFLVYAEIHKEAKRLGKHKIDSARLNYMLGVFYHRYWGLRWDMGRQTKRRYLDANPPAPSLDVHHQNQCENTPLPALIHPSAPSEQQWLDGHGLE